MSLGLVFCSRNAARTLARTPALQHHVWRSRLLSASSHTLGQQIPTTTLAEKESTKSFAIASRLRDGRALALDVWSVFK